MPDLTDTQHPEATPETGFRTVIEFEGGHPLLFDQAPAGRSGGLFAPLPEAVLERWKERGAKTVFAFVESAKDPRAQAAHRAGFQVQPVDVRRVRSNDFAFLAKLSTRLHEELLSHPVAFYFDRADTADVLSCAAVFLVAMGVSPELAAPEGAIQFVFGREELSREDLRVFQFKEATEPSYSMPAEVRRYFRLPQGGTPEGPHSGNGNGRHAGSEAITSKPIGVGVAGAPGAAAKEATGPDGAPVAAKSTDTAPAPVIEPAKTARTMPSGQPAPVAPAPAATLAPARADHSGLAFAASRFFTIRNKLLMIISTIIMSALGVMIYLASYFYRDDSRIRVNEFALNMTALIGQKTEGEFTSLAYTSLNTGAGLLARKNPAERALFTDLFFQNNQSFAYLSVLRLAGETLQPVETVVNEGFLKQTQIPRDRLDGLVNANAVTLKAAVASPVVRNVSPGLPIPLLALATSFGEGGERYIVVSLLDPARFQESFKSAGIIKYFMVDSAGIVIAHHDSKLVLAADNQSRAEIVVRMLQSKLGNGQISFRNSNGQAYLGFFQKLTFAGLGVASTVSEAEAFAAVQQMQNRNLMITVIVLFTAVLIVFFFSRTLSVPIVRLVNATQRVESGDYSFQISPSTRDEIGSLTHSFSSMTGGLAERERLKDSMTRFVNKEVAEKAARGELALGGQEKDCAIFFSDLRGFTAMSEKMTPEEVVEYLNEYFTDMVGCVSETHGVVDKYIGDAIMATWGAVGSVGNNTENAVNAALMMRARLIAFNERGRGLRPFAKFGCGINSGPVVSGQIGSSQKMEYTVIGDAVNLASRIETLNKPFGTDILISEDAYKRVADVFHFEKMPPITVKGKTEPQIIFAVLGRKDDPDCPKNMVEVRARTGGDPPKVDLSNFQETHEDKFAILQG